MTYYCKDCMHSSCLLAGVDAIAMRCDQMFVPKKKKHTRYTIFYCGRCGKQIARGRNVCRNCRAKQDWAAAE